MREVSDKVAFVTGGASGIGLGMARSFLAAGMKVVVADVRPEHLDEAREILAEHVGRSHYVQLDVRDRAAMAAAADELERVFGHCDILCNNAGVSTSVPIEEAAYADWDWVMGINLGGVINGIVEFLPRMKARGQGGHIVNTSSLAGLIALPHWAGIYSTTKFAIRGLSEALRLSLAPHQIGVSLLCPGMVNSRLPSSEVYRDDRSGSTAEEGGNFATPPVLEGGMDALEAGNIVLDGIRRNAGYILTHGESREELREIFDDILDSFPEPRELSPANMEFESQRRNMLDKLRADIQAMT